MLWAILALAVMLAAAGATAVTLAVKLGDARVETVKLGARGDALLLQNGTLTRQLGVEAAGRVDDQHRYEGVISGLKAEVARLEGELDADLEPTVVRGRLVGSGLLGSAETGTTAASGPVAAAALPPSVTAVLGAVGGGPGRAG